MHLWRDIKMEKICNYCGLSIKSGGITCLKFHLLHTDPHSNTKKCPNMSSEVKQEMNQLLEQKIKSKEKKTADMEEIRAELRGIMGGKHHSLIDEDEEEEGDEDVLCIRLTCTPMSEMNIEKQYVYQNLVNETEIRP